MGRREDKRTIESLPGKVRRDGWVLKPVTRVSGDRKPDASGLQAGGFDLAEAADGSGNPAAEVVGRVVAAGAFATGG